MIFDFILSVVAFLIRGVANLLPTISVFPTTLAADLASLMAYVNGWSWLFPISTLMTIIAILVIVVLAEFTYFVAMYVLGIVHASIK